MRQYTVYMEEETLTESGHYSCGDFSRHTTYKLLGVHIDSTHTHIELIIKKAIQLQGYIS